MKIVLLGYMGSGKTTISQILAQNLGLDFCDLDQIIEKNEETTVSDIFKNKGEIYFRKIESKTLQEFVKTNDNFVLALGGGTPCYANNHEILQMKELNSFYLKGNISTLFERLEVQKKQRPLIANFDAVQLEDYIRKHLFDRSFYYLQAKYIIVIDNKSIAEICLEIENKLR